MTPRGMLSSRISHQEIQQEQISGEMSIELKNITHPTAFQQSIRQDMR